VADEEEPHGEQSVPLNALAFPEKRALRWKAACESEVVLKVLVVAQFWEKKALDGGENQTFVKWG
jgi:hypothetical protein